MRTRSNAASLRLFYRATVTGLSHRSEEEKGGPPLLKWRSFRNDCLGRVGEPDYSNAFRRPGAARRRRSQVPSARHWEKRRQQVVELP
jgi:hypothetical protein